MNLSEIINGKNNFINEVNSRRTFCIISHPDAGKTTITEKFLLFGGAIQLAGTVKARKSKKFATADWMEIEKQRGISVTSSVMKFKYNNIAVNLLDTPGHQDFIEETFRALTAVDSALMVIDAAKGIESQTLKLWKVCQQQKIPVIVFINKLDREGIPPLELMQKVEEALGMDSVAITWPIGQGKEFKGVYDRITKEIFIFTAGMNKLTNDIKKIRIHEEKKLIYNIGKIQFQELKNDLELLDGAGSNFNLDEYKQVKQVAVFFGSAINNFGVKELLDHYLAFSPKPKPKLTTIRIVTPLEEKFSGFVFKIQANMDKNHRDQVVFIRICSGKFTNGMKLFHCRLKRQIKLNNPLFFNAQKRNIIDEAYSGDIIGVVDKGIYQIGDSLTQGEDLKFIGIPRFAPAFFARISINNPLKIKQLHKGLKYLSEEGTAQLFTPRYIGEQIIGVVGKLQLEVIKFRLENEYNVDCKYHMLPFGVANWISYENKNHITEFENEYSNNLFNDQNNRLVFLTNSQWELEYAKKKHSKIKFFFNSDKIN